MECESVFCVGGFLLQQVRFTLISEFLQELSNITLHHCQPEEEEASIHRSYSTAISYYHYIVWLWRSTGTIHTPGVSFIPPWIACSSGVYSQYSILHVYVLMVSVQNSQLKNITVYCFLSSLFWCSDAPKSSSSSSSSSLFWRYLQLFSCHLAVWVQKYVGKTQTLLLGESERSRSTLGAIVTQHPHAYKLQFLLLLFLDVLQDHSHTPHSSPPELTNACHDFLRERLKVGCHSGHLTLVPLHTSLLGDVPLVGSGNWEHSWIALHAWTRGFSRYQPFPISHNCLFLV